MAQLTDIVAVVVAALNVLAGALGGYAWWYGEAGPAFWRAVRAGRARGRAAGLRLRRL